MDKEKKSVDKVFNEQERDNDFRHPDILKYRNKAKKVLNSNLDKRFNDVSSKKLETEKITDEKLEKRNKSYGQKHLKVELERIEEGVNKGKLRYVIKNNASGKIKHELLEKEGWTKKEHENYLRNKVKQKGFKYENEYIKEDSEPRKDYDSRENFNISYTTFWRFGIIIYKMTDGKRYQVIYQNSNSFRRSGYNSYQRLIAEVKSNILNETGITLEEWIYLAKTKNNIYVEGGFSYKRFKAIKEKDKAFKEKLDYKYTVNFEEL